VYTKKTGSRPDFSDPVVLTNDRAGTTVESLCKQVRAGSQVPEHTTDWCIMVNLVDGLVSCDLTYKQENVSADRRG